MRDVFGLDLDKDKAFALRFVQAGLSDADRVAAATMVGLSLAEVNIAKDVPLQLPPKSWLGFGRTT